MGTMTFTPKVHIEPLGLLSGHPTPSLEKMRLLSQSKVTQQEKGAGGGEEGSEKWFLRHSLVSLVCCSDRSWHSCGWAQFLGSVYVCDSTSGPTTILLRALLGPQSTWAPTAPWSLPITGPWTSSMDPGNRAIE